MSEKKIDLIAQLLAKAESTTPAEAEALTEHAERLMIKYGIEQAVINERRATQGSASEKIITIKIVFNGAYRLEWLSLGHSVVMGLGGLRALQSTYRNKEATLHIFGFESDVQQAEVLINSLRVQSTVAVRAWWKANSASHTNLSSYDQEAARRSFVKGFGYGAGKRIKDGRLHIVQEAGAGTELVLVSRDAKVQAHLDGITTSPNRSRGGKGSTEAAGQGYRAGQNANTGGKTVTQGRGITA